jgi:hypothetical protein
MELFLTINRKKFQNLAVDANLAINRLIAIIAAIGFTALSLTGCQIEDKIETVATPTATPEAGPVTGSTSVTLTCATPGADIKYTIDGSTPAKDNNKTQSYSGPITGITPGTMIKAMAVKRGMYDSSILVAGYPGSMPADAIPLNENIWIDGNLPASNSVQWFKFTATTNTQQFIHASLGTMNDFYGIYVQVYNSSGYKVGDKQQLYGSYSISVYRPVTSGQDYYIKVWPYNTSKTGTYKIAFNKSSSSDSIIEMMPADAIPLTENIWADGNLPASNPEQWFKFTATASIQYIHAAFGTIGSSRGLYVQVYDSNSVKVGNMSNLWGSTINISRAVTVNKVYYIKVIAGGFPYTGTYQIAFNTSSKAPSLTVTLPSNPITLTENILADGNLTASNPEQWFKFTAARSTNTQYIHVSFGTLDSSDGVNVQVYDSNGEKNGSEENLYGADIYRYMTRGVTANLEYYIRVRSNISTGTYKILLSKSWTSPVTPPSNATLLTENTWADGNLPTSNSEQWFKFTATTSTNDQYIHVSFGTLNSSDGVYVQMYDSYGVAVEDRQRLYGDYYRNASRGVTIGHDYYIKVWSFSSNYIGTYQIAFNTSSTTPPPP